MYVSILCACLVPLKALGVCWIHGFRVMDCCELYGCWELNLDSCAGAASAVTL